jgi:hypothetical protein
MLAIIQSMRIKETLGYTVTIIIAAVICYLTFRSLLAQTRKSNGSGSLVDTRPGRPSLLYFGAFSIGFALIGLVLYGTSNFPLAFVVLAFFVGTPCAFFGSFRLRLRNDQLEYWSLECGYQSLRLAQIQRAQMRVGLSSRPGIRLEILPTSSDLKPIFIALKAFRKADLDRVFDWLGPKLEDHEKSKRFK